MKKIYCSIVVLVTFSCSQAQQDCKLKKDQDSIKVYTCHTDTSRYKSIVAEFDLHSTLDQLGQVILDIPGYTRWQYNTIEAKPIKIISGSEQIYRTVIAAPWPVTNRDMVVNIKIKYDQSNHGMMITTESKAGIIPVAEGFVRVPSSRGIWTVRQKNKNQLHVRFTMQIDPGGIVPAWIVNWVCAQAPYQSFKNLKGIFEKKNKMD